MGALSNHRAGRAELCEGVCIGWMCVGVGVCEGVCVRVCMRVGG